MGDIQYPKTSSQVWRIFPGSKTVGEGVFAKDVSWAEAGMAVWYKERWQDTGQLNNIKVAPNVPTYEVGNTPLPPC